MTEKKVKKPAVKKQVVPDTVLMINELTEKVALIKRTGRETWLVSGIVYAVSVIMKHAGK